MIVRLGYVCVQDSLSRICPCLGIVLSRFGLAQDLSMSRICPCLGYVLSRFGRVQVLSCLGLVCLGLVLSRICPSRFGPRTIQVFQQKSNVPINLQSFIYGRVVRYQSIWQESKLILTKLTNKTIFNDYRNISQKLSFIEQKLIDQQSFEITFNSRAKNKFLKFIFLNSFSSADIIVLSKNTHFFKLEGFVQTKPNQTNNNIKNFKGVACLASMLDF